MAPRYEQIDSGTCSSLLVQDILCYFSLLIDSPVVPSIACEVANSRSRGGERPSSVAVNHSLKLFIFLERAGSKRVGNDNEQWRQTMEVIHELRTSFNTLVVTHSRKFHQALHSVLNKLICNYGTHAKVRSDNAVEHYRGRESPYAIVFTDQLSVGYCHSSDSRGCFKHCAAQHQ